MPAIQEAVKDIFNKDPHLGINPDEVVAIGAATQAGILRGDIKDILLLDVIPLSLGIETLGGVFTRLIEKNTTIPTSKTQIFSTAADNQPSVEVHVLQGERGMAADNKTLARFMLDGIPPSARGTPQVEVSFDIDANGILDVKALDKATKKTQSVRIEASSALSKEEIEKLKKDAQLHAEEDKEKKELVELKNQAEALVYTAEKSLKDAGDKVPSDTKNEIEEKLKSLKGFIETGETEAIKNGTAELSSALQKIGEILYEEKADSGDEAAGDEGQEDNPDSA